MEKGHVDRDYLDEALSRIVGDPGFLPPGWNPAEIKDFRRLVEGAWAAEVDTDLRNMRSLRIQSHPGDPTRATARLSSGRTIGLIFKNAESTVAFELLPTETDTP